MKTFLGLWGLSLLSFTWTHIDDWSVGTLSYVKLNVEGISLAILLNGQT
uniref:Oocyte secreted protein 1 n=1 Tax=Nannospalax galili TaxID=1026970 RepID=A0A8C6RMN0_NANGA